MRSPLFASLIVFLALFLPHKGHAQIIGNPTAMAQSTTGESSHVFKSTGPGYLYSLGTTTSAAGWLMVFNTTTAPSNGAVTPANCYQVAANTSVLFPYATPFPFSTGITAVFSSTGCFTLTLANAFFAAQVR